MTLGYLYIQDTSLTIFSAKWLGLAVSGSELLWNVCKENDDFSTMIKRKRDQLSIPALCAPSTKQRLFFLKAL